MEYSRIPILTWSGDNTARLWLLNVDLDFPPQQIELWFQAETGTTYDLASQQVKFISPDMWREIQHRYELVAIEHAKICKYPEANYWLQRHLPTPNQ